MHVVYFGDADTAYLAIHQHLASATLAYAAFETAVAAINAVAVDRKTCLMEGGGDGIALLPTHFLAVVDEFDRIGLRNVEDGMMCNLVHVIKCLMIIL